MGQHLDTSIIHIKANFCHSLLLLLFKRKHAHIHTHMTKGSMKGGKDYEYVGYGYLEIK